MKIETENSIPEISEIDSALLIKSIADKGKKIMEPAKNNQKSLFAKASDLVSGMRAPAWVIKGMLESDALALMYGAPGDGKSFVSFDLACCVATGTPWHGHKVRQGPVVYIAGEGQGGVSRRLAAWEKFNGVSLADAPLYVSLRSVSLLDADSAKQVAADAESIIPAGVVPVFVVIDTVARAFVGGDENSSQDMSKFVSIIDSCFKEKWKANVLLVHHSGKNTDKGARGSSALKGALDQEFSLEKKDKVITLRCTKMKDGEPTAAKEFELQTVQLAEIIDQFGDVEIITSAVPVDKVKVVYSFEEKEAEKRSRKAAQSFDAYDLIEFIRNQGKWPGMSEIADHFSCSKSSASTVLQDAESKGLIKSLGSGSHKTYELVETPF